MPMYDRQFLSCYRALPFSFRAGKHFPFEVVRRLHPGLLHFPISHGGILVPARPGSAMTLAAILRHEALRSLSVRMKRDLTRWDNARPHLLYPRWLSARCGAFVDARIRDFIGRHAEWFRAGPSAPMDSHARYAIEYLSTIEEMCAIDPG
jgi:hypothetical protein